MKYFRSLLIIYLAFLVACSGLPPSEGTPTRQETLQPTSTALPSGVTLPAPVASPTESGPVTLRVWVPPQFNATSDTLASNLLQARLSEFSKRRPGVRVETRVKAVDGPGGLLDSLTTASAAAPLALPDLVALPRDLMETAALKGLLQPYDGLTQTLDESDWFEYAQQLAHLQGSIYGLPFAGDALTLVYRPSVVTTPPPDWPTTLELRAPLLYPAADPLALFTLTLYQANGGEVRDEQGRPFLDAVILSQVLTFYAQAEEGGVMPDWLTQFQEDAQVRDAFLENRADIIVTWASHYLSASLEDAALAPIPTPEGESYTLATGWVWALSTHQADHQELCVELAEFLTASSFLASWTEAVGYLPPRPSALNAWSETLAREHISQIVDSAQLLPAADILTSAGIPLQQATVQILKRQDDPVTAAQAAGASLVEP